MAGAVYAWRNGFLFVMPWLFGLAFIPAALVVYNETALAFGAVYAVFGYAGQGVGLGLKRLIGRWRSD